MTDSSKKIDQTHGSKEPSAQTVARDGKTSISVLEDGSLDPVYEAKAKMLNKAIQDIGMGRYQWQVSAGSSGAHLHSINTLSIKDCRCVPIRCCTSGHH
jgi:hypothetical protein